MELPLDAAALDKPTAEIVRPIYEALVTTFLGVTRCSAGRSPLRSAAALPCFVCHLWRQPSLSRVGGNRGAGCDSYIPSALSMLRTQQAMPTRSAIALA